MMGMLAVLAEYTSASRLALAYIDPATTSYLIQIGAGVVIAVGTVLGIYRNKLKRMLKKNKNEEAPQIEKENTTKKEVITADDLMADDDE